MSPPDIGALTARAATAADAEALRAFRAFHPPGLWFERDAMKVLNTARRLLTEGELAEHQQVLMFESEDKLVALALLEQEEDSLATGHVALIAVHRGWHGSRVDGAKLSEVVLSTALEHLERAGFIRATAYVARVHGRSKTLLERLDFKYESLIDGSYELHAVDF